MSEPVIRFFQQEDRPGAVALWNRVFGDPPEVVHGFLDLFASQDGFCAVADCAGTIAAAAYAMDGVTLHLPGEKPISGTYLYAVATDPAFRKQGLAAEVCRVLQRAAFARGIGCLFTHPAEHSLFPWYEEKIGAVPAIFCRHLTVTESHAAHMVTELTPEEYGSLREERFKGTSHVSFPDRFLQWEHLLHQAYGGGFYQIGSDIADVFADGNALEIGELLSADPVATAASLLAHLGAETAHILLPGGDTPYISCAPATGRIPDALDQVWFGPVFG